MQMSKIVFWIILVLLVIDLIGFTAWALSGQRPADEFYIGALTANALMIIK